MKSGISPVVGTVLLIAIAVIGAVAVWYWSSSYTGKPVLPQVTFSSYTVVSVYKNASGDGCSSLDIRNTGGGTLNMSSMYIREITSGRSTSVGTNQEYIGYINMSALDKNQVGNFPILGFRTMANFTGSVIALGTTVDYVHAIGDVDNDGLNELVFGAKIPSSDFSLAMYKNVSGGWVGTNITTQAIYIESIAIGDANGDGKNELVIGESANNTLRMYRNSSLSNLTANWQETNISSFTSYPKYIAIGNADNIAGNEIVAGFITNTGLGISMNYTLRMYKNTSGGWRETNISAYNGTLSNLTVNSVAIGNPEGAGAGNSVIVSYYYSAVSYYGTALYKNVSGGWNMTDLSSFGNGTKFSSVGDVNNDGSNEIVLSIFVSPDGTYLINKTGGNWALTTISTDKSEFNMIGDADNDGRNETVSVDFSGHGAGYFRMYDNKSGGWTVSDITPSYIYNADLPSMGDANNDGGNELLVRVSGGAYQLYTVITVPDVIGASLPRGTYILRTSGQGYSDQRFTCV